LHLHDAVRALIRHAGGDPDDPGLADTPRRYLAALSEMTGGRHADIGAILSAQYPSDGCDVVEATGIRFTSLCPHHLLPYTGTAAVRYRPAGRVVGLSKLARLVEALARRPVMQEQLAADVADAVMKHLEPHSVEVEVKARHGCVQCRGVRQAGMRVMTMARRGDMRGEDV
jgi:GTP cyclohydrolase I